MTDNRTNEPTPEQILVDEWIRQADRAKSMTGMDAIWFPDAEETLAVLRTHGLLSEGTPSEDDREALVRVVANHPIAPLMRLGGDAGYPLADAILAAGFSRAAVPDAAPTLCVECNEVEVLGKPEHLVLCMDCAYETGRAAVPNAASEAKQPDGWSTEDRREAKCEAERRWSRPVVREADYQRQSGTINGFILGAEWQKARETFISYRAIADEAEAERDAALAAIERVRVVAFGHGKGAEDLPVDRDALKAALDGAPEPDDDPCKAETHSWSHYRPEQIDSYWIRCTRLGKHDEHEDSNTGLSWREPVGGNDAEG